MSSCCLALHSSKWLREIKKCSQWRLKAKVQDYPKNRCVLCYFFSCTLSYTHIYMTFQVINLLCRMLHLFLTQFGLGGVFTAGIFGLVYVWVSHTIRTCTLSMLFSLYTYLLHISHFIAVNDGSSASVDYIHGWQSQHSKPPNLSSLTHSLFYAGSWQLNLCSVLWAVARLSFLLWEHKGNPTEAWGEIYVGGGLLSSCLVKKGLLT